MKGDIDSLLHTCIKCSTNSYQACSFQSTGQRNNTILLPTKASFSTISTDKTLRSCEGKKFLIPKTTKRTTTEKKLSNQIFYRLLEL